MFKRLIIITIFVTGFTIQCSEPEQELKFDFDVEAANDQDSKNELERVRFDFEPLKLQPEQLIEALYKKSTVGSKSPSEKVLYIAESPRIPVSSVEIIPMMAVKNIKLMENKDTIIYTGNLYDNSIVTCIYDKESDTVDCRTSGGEEEYKSTNIQNFYRLKYLYEKEKNPSLFDKEVYGTILMEPEYSYSPSRITPEEVD